MTSRPSLALLGAVLLAVPAVGLALPPPPPLAHLQVKAFINGTSALHLTADPVTHDTTVSWHHQRRSAPGLWNGHHGATFFKDVGRQPTWPNPGENFFCNCFSDTISLTSLALADIVSAGTGITPTQLQNDLSVVAFAATNTLGLPTTVTFQQCRGACSAAQVGNDRVITLNDDAPGGAAWYVFDIAP